MSCRVTVLGVWAVSFLFIMGCAKEEAAPKEGSFKAARAFLKGEASVEAAIWQGWEARVRALDVAGAIARRELAAADAGAAAARWAKVLERTPAPLPLRAPLAVLRKALNKLAATKGEVRGPALAEVERAVADLQRRNTEPVPDPLVALKDGPYLLRLWRDVGGLKSLGTKDLEVDGQEDWLKRLRREIQEAPPAENEGDLLVRALSTKLLDVAMDYRTNPPQVDQRTALRYQRGQIGPEVINALLCKAFLPMKEEIAALQAIGAKVKEGCRKGCASAAVDLLHHPLLRELRTVAQKAADCGPSTQIASQELSEEPVPPPPPGLPVVKLKPPTGASNPPASAGAESGVAPAAAEGAAPVAPVAPSAPPK